MDGPGHDTGFALPSEYRAGAIISHREFRMVLRATRVDDGSQRILKCLVPPFPAEEEAAFRSEFLLLDALRHPGWVRPYRFGRLADGGCFLEMEESPGVTLSHWPIRGWWPETLAVAHQVLSGLEVLHRLGYAHLDLGPEQVLVASGAEPTPWDAEVAEAAVAGAATSASDLRTRVRLLDLGLAAPLGSSVGARGTPGSIAPELLRAQPGWDARADLYAVGTILFELFTGRPAFPGRTVREVLARQMEGPEPDPGNGADLPPPVRDLVRELLARDPASRPRSALETWQRLREQAPRAHVGALPPFLVPGEAFAFIGREAEIAAFSEWLAALDPVTASATFTLVGETGVGCRRLAERLGAVAESCGWVRAGATEAGGLATPGTAADGRRTDQAVMLQNLRGGTVRIVAGAAAPAPPAETRKATSSPECARDAQGTVRVVPMSADDLGRILAAAGFESEVLCRRLVALCLGNPGLLAGLVAVLPREVDFATRHAGEHRLDATLDQLPIPNAWLVWARELLRGLSHSDRGALLLAGLAGLPGMPEATSVGPSSVSVALERLLHRGLLVSEDNHWRASGGLWARALTSTDSASTAAVGRMLLAELEMTGDAVVRVRVSVALRESSAAAAALPEALTDLAARGRREEAIVLYAEASSLGPAVLRDLGESDFVGLLEGVFGLGTRSGALLPEPASTPAASPLGAADLSRSRHAAARVLLDVWAWMGRQQRDRAEAALVAAEAALASHRERSEPVGRDCSDPLPFLAGWFRYRLLDVERDPEASRQALRRLREKLRADDRRRHAACDISEAAILSREGRHGEAQRLLDSGLDTLGDLEEGEQAAYLNQVAVVHLAMGADRLAAEALAQTESRLRHAGSTVNRLVATSIIGGVAFGEGDLPHAQACNEELLREQTARAHWNEAANALCNLALILEERGRLGEATRALRDAASLSARATRPLTARRLAGRRVELLVHCGLVARAEEEAERFFIVFEAVAPAAALFVRASLGESLFAQGRMEEGRSQFRRAVTGFVEADSSDDAAETLSRWGLAESASGHFSESRQRLAEMDTIRARATGLTRSAIALLEAESDLSSATDHRAQAFQASAERAVDVLEAQQRWSMAWRAHWCLARARRAAGNAKKALDSYESARAILTGIVESLSGVARTDGFLQLPAVRRFLEELGRL